MKYSKPRIVPSGSALATIQGHSKGMQFNLDAAQVGPNKGQYNATIGAYEADE
jgi:hypothetical protein